MNFQIQTSHQWHVIRSHLNPADWRPSSSGLAANLSDISLNWKGCCKPAAYILLTTVQYTCKIGYILSATGQPTDSHPRQLGLFKNPRAVQTSAWRRLPLKLLYARVLNNNDEQCGEKRNRRKQHKPLTYLLANRVGVSFGLLGEFSTLRRSCESWVASTANYKRWVNLQTD